MKKCKCGILILDMRTTPITINSSEIIDFFERVKESKKKHLKAEEAK